MCAPLVPTTNGAHNGQEPVDARRGTGDGRLFADAVAVHLLRRGANSPWHPARGLLPRQRRGRSLHSAAKGGEDLPPGGSARCKGAHTHARVRAYAPHGHAHSPPAQTLPLSPEPRRDDPETVHACCGGYSSARSTRPRGAGKGTPRWRAGVLPCRLSLAVASAVLLSPLTSSAHSYRFGPCATGRGFPNGMRKRCLFTS